MQMIDIATVKAAKATDRKALAILAYDNATANPGGANWRAVADMLRLAMPASKAKPAETATDSRFAPWADYAIPKTATGQKLGKSPVIVVAFADGETVRAPAVSLPGKPLNIGRALRVAIAFYQCRIAGRMGANSDSAHVVAVPGILSATCETTGAEFDPADCSARTADARAGSFDYAAALAAATGANDFERGNCLQKAFGAAVRDTRRASEPAADYTDDDRAALAAWADGRPSIGEAIRDAGGEIWLTAGAAARLGWAVMTFWPDLADVELVPVAPAEIAPPPPVAAAEMAPASPPATPTFRVPSRFLQSSRLNVVPLRPVAPSRGGASILRVA